MSELVRLSAVSTLVTNIEAPINLLLVGPPGDGKTAMLLRSQRLPNVQVLSDGTYLGLCAYLNDVRDNLSSCLVIPDLATIVGRRDAVGKQAIATLAMMCAEGVRTIRVGRTVRDYQGARSSVMSAITYRDLLASSDILDQNAFLSRVFVIDFDLTWQEQEKMMERKVIKGNRSLLSQFRFRRIKKTKHGLWETADVTVSQGHARTATRWWVQLRRKRNDRWFAFRTADALIGLLQASAFMSGRKRVTLADVRYIRERILPLIETQVNVEHVIGGKHG